MNYQIYIIRTFFKLALFLKFLGKKLTENAKRVHRILATNYEKIESYTQDYNNPEYIYKDLTPKEEQKGNKAYIEALDWALSRDNILNIALTGPYGSGKSSILKTYEQMRTHYRYLNLSLATFHSYLDSDDEKDDKNEEEYDERGTLQSLSENEIEKRILQQLFYKVDSSKILFARFRKIIHVGTRKILKGTLAIISAVFLATLLFIPQIYSDLTKKISNNNSYLKDMGFTDPIILIMYILLLVLTMSIFVFASKRIYRSIKFSKIKIKDAEFEAKTQNEDSIINKFLDEILYFFEVNPYGIIFIEDLDRFNDVKIFMKLRELNSLINNSEQINRKVVFIYAIKDDMFANKERTKFFDYIIPVIPIINSVNSGDILWKELKLNSLDHGLTEPFINDICLYIDDMRILNNIFNEYIIYKNKLMKEKDSFLRLEKMFAMIVYKNIYPNEFSKLQYDQGILHGTFSRKQELINLHISDLEKECKKIEKQIRDVDNEHLQSAKEVKTIYWNEITNYNSNICQINVEGQDYLLSQILNNDIDMRKIVDNFQYNYGSSGYGYNTSRGAINAEAKEKFIKRMDLINKKSSDFQNSSYVKMEEIRNQQTQAKLWSLKVAIEKIGIERFFPERNRENALLIFLLRNGHVDEMYPHYINCFYEGSLTHHDMKFIMKIKDQIALEFSHPLIKLEKLITRLNKEEFQRKEILNYSLVNYLIDNSTKYEEQFNYVMEQLRDETETSVKYIESFIEFATDKGKFINELCKRWHNIWTHISNSTLVTINRREEILRLIILNASLNDIMEINENSLLGKYIADMPGFLEFIPNENIELIKNIIKVLDIRFTNLKLSDRSDVKLLEFIAEDNFYELNYNMVRLITMYKSNVTEDAFMQRHLTTIKAINYKPLWNYIQENLFDYIWGVFLNLSSNTGESEEIVIELLKNEEILPYDTRKAIIEKENIVISDINSTLEDLWEYAFSKLKVKCSWGNVLSLYCKNEEISNSLAGFLNMAENYSALSESLMNLDNDFEEDVYEGFTLELICFSDISETALDKLQRSFVSHYEEFPCDRIDSSRLKQVISYNLIKFTEYNYQSIRTHHKSVLGYFISRNIKAFISGIENYQIDSEDAYNFIVSKYISMEYKLIIIEEIGCEITCDTSDFADALCNLIFQSKRQVEIPENIITDILSCNITQEFKIELLLNQIKYIDFKNMDEYLNSIGYPYDQMMIKMKKPIINYTEMNRKLVEILKANNLISSFSMDKAGRLKVVANYK